MFTAITIDCIFFIFIHAIPLLAGGYLAQKLFASTAERIALTLLLFFIQGLLVFGILGYCRILNLNNVLFGNLTTGLLLAFIAHLRRNIKVELPSEPIPDESDNAMLRWLQTTVLFFMAFCLADCAFTGGIDQWLYHIFYPLEWIKAGRVYAVSLPGLPHEYFPQAAELILGYLLIPGGLNIFYPFFQLAGLVMALAAMSSLWRYFKCSQLAVTSALLLIFSTSIIMLNAVLCYSDVMTGAFLVAGICFTALAMLRNGKNDLMLMICGAVALGISAGMKYSGLVAAPFAVLILLGIFLGCGSLRRSVDNLPAKSVILAVVSFVSALVFYLPNWIKTGNPFYPVKIPGVFSKGIDFERETVPWSNIWNFFVNRNFWDMNVTTAIFYISLPVLAIGVWFLRRKSAQGANARKFFAGLATGCIVLFFIHIMIYPAMAQARQIIPILMVSALLIAPVLDELLISRLAQGKYKWCFCIFIGILCILLIFKKSLLLIGIYAALVIVAAVCALIKKASLRKGLILTVVLCLAVRCMWVFVEIRRFPFALIGIVAGNTGWHIIDTLNNLSLQKVPCRVASVGSWYNALITSIVPSAEIFYIPINVENTTSPHLVDDIKKLRSDPVEYAVFYARLKERKCTHLLIDLESHQDFLENRDLELKWAQAHPEDFTLLHTDGKIYFFKIN